MALISLNELEKRVKETLISHSQDTVEISNLTEKSYRELKKIFSGDYEIKGIININRLPNILKMEDEGKNYIIHIRKK